MENVFFRNVEGKERTLVPKASIGTQLKVLHPHTQYVAGAFWEAVCLSNQRPPGLDLRLSAVN